MQQLFSIRSSTFRYSILTDLFNNALAFRRVNVWHFGTVSNWKIQSKIFNEFHHITTTFSKRSILRFRTSEIQTKTSVFAHWAILLFAICFLINANSIYASIYVYALRLIGPVRLNGVHCKWFTVNHTVLLVYKVCSTNCYIWHMARKSVDSRLSRRSPLKALEVSTFWAHFWLY